jgi:hypothetical protein
LAVNGKTPNLVLIVTVEEAFMHCSKCMIRSRLWRQDEWPDRSSVATLAEAMIAHAAPRESVSEVQAKIDDSYENRLY